MGEETGWDADKVTLFVCKTCRGADGTSRPGAGLIGLLREAFGDAEAASRAIRPVTCLVQCKSPASAALVHRNGWSYVFHGLTEDHIADLSAGARMLAADERGFLPLKGRPPSLRSGLAARIPPFSHQEDLS
ncbi:DUF1636 family protein [Rhizobiaceae bacterium BDR2-2]|uniref:DUF1636 family protein n=1 Tax=Ectorhizobium quercum TaxID=2965071 RepID=A0AAE3N0T3_9HYPH|nr:DUF1636 family protein [Ectorhizobium quercum]MCX8998051.1 DUF1636 family protein [Ectorhizobium quercum]